MKTKKFKYKILKEIEDNSIEIGCEIELDEVCVLDTGKTIPTYRLVKYGYLKEVQEEVPGMKFKTYLHQDKHSMYEQLIDEGFSEEFAKENAYAFYETCIEWDIVDGKINILGIKKDY